MAAGQSFIVGLDLTDTGRNGLALLILAVAVSAARALMQVQRAATSSLLDRVQAELQRDRRTPKPEGRAQKVERLTKSLRESASLLDELERDIADGQAQADEIQARIDKAAKVASLSEVQAQAVRGVLEDVVAESARRSFWDGLWIEIAVGTFFFAAGVSVTLLLT